MHTVREAQPAGRDGGADDPLRRLEAVRRRPHARGTHRQRRRGLRHRPRACWTACTAGGSRCGTWGSSCRTSARPRERRRLMEPPDRSARRRLYGTIDTIRHRFGHAAVVTGESLAAPGTPGAERLRLRAPHAVADEVGPPWQTPSHPCTSAAPTRCWLARSRPRRWCGAPRRPATRSLALTDVNGLYGATVFWKLATEAGISPILGAELTADPARRPGRRLPRRGAGGRGDRLRKPLPPDHVHPSPKVGAGAPPHEEAPVATLCRPDRRTVGGAVFHRGCPRRGRGAPGGRAGAPAAPRRPGPRRAGPRGGPSAARLRGAPAPGARGRRQPPCWSRRRTLETARLLAAIRLGKTFETVPPSELPHPQAHLRGAEELRRQYAELPQAVQNNRRLAERCAAFRLLPRRAGLPALSPAPTACRPPPTSASSPEAGARRRYGQVRPGRSGAAGEGTGADRADGLLRVLPGGPRHRAVRPPARRARWPGAAAAPAAWWPTCWGSPTSARWRGTSPSSGSSTSGGRTSPTWTWTSAGACATR